MKTKLLIATIALGSFAFFASCVSEEEMRRQAEEKARQEQIAREQAEQTRIAREKAEAEEWERQLIAAEEAAKRAEAERIAREKAEAEERERQRIAAEEAVKRAEEERIAREKAEAEERERQRIAALKAGAEEEINATLARLDDIFATYNKISTEDRSRGNAILEAFGNEHLPFFMEKYRSARTETLEAEQNLKELVEELNNSGLKAEEDETYQVLYKNKCQLQAIYWTIFYKIVDQYSQFKIGVLTTDDLVKIDEELCEIY